MNTGELHVQAGFWENHASRYAALYMEGEARDRSNGEGMAADALYRVALARGLRLTTDLDHLDRRPVPGWRVRIDDGFSLGSVAQRQPMLTLEWPGFWPLLLDAPLSLPPGWLPAAAGDGLVLVFVGYGLGLHEHRHDGEAHTVTHLRHVAEAGALASGAVSVISLWLQDHDM